MFATSGLFALIVLALQKAPANAPNEDDESSAAGGNTLQDQRFYAQSGRFCTAPPGRQLLS